MHWPTCTFVRACQCICIINVHNCLEEGSVLEEHVTVSRVGLQLQSKKKKLQACEKTERWAGALEGLGRFTELRKRKIKHAEQCSAGSNGEKSNASIYWNSDASRSLCSACSPLSAGPSVMCVCVHWGLQLAHQTHSSRESTLPLQSPLRRLGSSKETGNL